MRRALVACFLVAVGIAGCSTSESSADVSADVPVVLDCCAADGTLESGAYLFEANREADLSEVQFPHDELPPSSYGPCESCPVAAVWISEGLGEATVADGAECTWDGAMAGTRVTEDTERWHFELLEGTFAGARLVVWGVPGGLEAELTIYGSGRPTVASHRGTLTKLTDCAGPTGD